MQLLKREPDPTISDRSTRKCSFNQYLKFKIRCFALIIQAKIVGDTIFINGFKNGFKKEELIYYLLEQQADEEMEIVQKINSSKKANLQWSNEHGDTQLLVACNSGSIEKMKYLLGGRDPFTIGNVALVQYLIDQGSKDMNSSILYEKWSQFKLNEVLKEIDIIKNGLIEIGNTPLMVACTHYENEIAVKYYNKNREGDTTLHEAWQCGNLQTIVEYPDYSSSNPNANTNANTNANANTNTNTNTNTNINTYANYNNTKVINANGNGNALANNNNNNNNNFNLFSPSSSSFSKIPLSSSSGSYYLLEELNFFSSLSNMNCLIQYILLNYNLYDIYTFAKGAITYFSEEAWELEKHSEKKKRTRKILRKNMYVRAPNAEYSVRLSNRDIICLCESIRKCCDYLNIPTTPKSVETKGALSIKIKYCKNLAVVSIKT
ncbi:hypothetical protein H8356DRAFT_1365754 [Neocallimastix lanati (nom. inval.)]|nr:hypothetical protein H8356DRAFT_1365754 [Neocallimastix sp. JGI-2020a]